jgi:MFS superfamily sulfate permease-like transporter
VTSRYFLLDAEAVTFVDVSGVYTLNSLRDELAEQGIVLGIARARGLFRMMLDRSGVAEKIGTQHFFHTVHDGANSFRMNGATCVSK